MLYRKIEKKITEWIDSTGREALLLTGARQIGKTYLIRELLKRSGQDFVEFNLIEQPSLIPLFQAAKENDTGTFLARLSVATGHKLIKGKTIIFFDEVQEYRDIVTAVKFLVDDGTFKYIMSGSLLGVELRNLRSAPVGYLSVLDMFPMDLEEFLLALNIKQETLDYLRDCYDGQKEVDEFIHRKIMDAFYTYLVVGGMPDAVKTYVEQNDFNKVSRVHSNIIRMYEQDFTKYEERDRLKLIKTYDLIPSELNSKNKRYVFTDLDKNLKFDRYENSFNWLSDAGVALPVFNTTEPVVPLKINKQANLFKLFLSDVGMLSTMFGRATQMAILDRADGINCGAIFENVVAQELAAHGYEGYYFASKKQGELDFVIEHEGKCLPIEVKSGKDYTRHNALSNVLANNDYGIERAFILSGNNVSVKGKLVYLPIYMTMFINEKAVPLPTMAHLDLSGL